MTDMKIWLLPEPDSPTTPSRLAGVDAEADAVDRLDVAFGRGEADVEVA